MVPARALVVLPIAILLALGAVRAMTFVAPNDHQLRSLEAMFHDHPQAATDRAMTEIGASAARGGQVPAAARSTLAGVAKQAPLLDQPFLVEGTIAQMAGNPDRAEQLFLAARTRNPRSQGALYFLADQYLKTNRILPGLIEMGILSRLSETASQSMVPALAAYARSPGAIAQLRRYFATSPTVRDSTLSLLAGDPHNGPLVLSLAPSPRPGAPLAEWQQRLIQAQVTAGDYGAAETLWKRFTGVVDRGLLFDPQFHKLNAPPPFNWSYTGGSAGVAEASGKGGLDVIYYGRESTSLASQTLRLTPGQYRLSMRVAGTARAVGLTWTISCVPGNAALLNLPLAAVDQDQIGGSFGVSANCPTQLLELRGEPDGSGQTVERTILDLTLKPLAGAS